MRLQLLLFFCQLAIVAAKHPPCIIEDLIEELNHGIGAITNVFYHFDVAAPPLPVSDVAQLVYPNRTSTELPPDLSPKVLFIVALQANIKELQVQLVRQVSSNWSTVELLFIAEAPDDSDWRGLFEICWQRGIYNVLLLHTPTCELHTFTPFPRVRSHRTNIAAYLAGRNNWRNLQRYPIRAVSGDEPPRGLIFRDLHGKVHITGVYSKLLLLFAAHYNANLQLIADNSTLKYSFTDCIVDLRMRKYDICADITFTKFTRVTAPLFISTVHLYVRYAQPLQRFEYFWAPFAGKVWWLIAATIGYIALLLAVVHRFQGGDWQLGAYLLQVFSSLLYLPFSLARLRGGAKIAISLLLYAMGFIITNFYLAFLFSILSTDLYEPQIESLSDLRAFNISVMGSPFMSFFFRVYNMEEAPRLEQVDMFTMRRHRDALDPNYAYINLRDIVEFYLYQQKFLLRPRMKMLPQALAGSYVGMPMQANWPFQVMLNRLLRRAFEAGFYDRFMAETKEEAIRMGFIKFFKTEYKEVKALDMDDFEIAGMLLGVGYLLAIFVFMGEIFYAWLKVRLVKKVRRVDPIPLSNDT